MQFYLLVLGFFGLGIVLQRANGHQQLIDALNKIIIRVVLPALVLTTLTDIVLTLDVLFPVAIAWLMLLIAMIVVWFIGGYAKWSREVVFAAVFMMGLGNTAMLGIPLIRILLGEDYLAAALAYDQFGSFLIVTIVATASIAAFEHKSPVFDVRKITMNIFSFPPFISVIVALLLPSTSLLGVALPVLKVLALTLAPMSMLLVGLQFSVRLSPEYFSPTLWVLGMRALVLPLLVALIGIGLGINNYTLYPTIMQSAMPPMITVAILLMSNGIAPRFVASVLGVGTLLSMVTLPAIAFISKSFIV
jgi:hypothetical protein